MIEHRFEFKYLLNPITARQAERFVVHQGLNPDPLAPSTDGSYYVTSLYFDNVKQSDYYDKKGGFLSRTKVRLRTHNPILNYDTKKSWLELKSRHDAMIKKIRCPIDQRELKTLLLEGPVILWRSISKEKQADLAPILWEIIETQRIPKMLVRYLRRAYVGQFKGDRIRVTFDFGTEISPVSFLTGLLAGEKLPGRRKELSHGWLSAEPRQVILEIKATRSLPGWFGNLVRILELERVSVSKYARSVEMAKWYEATPH